jgi:hypothetical protein
MTKTQIGIALASAPPVEEHYIRWLNPHPSAVTNALENLRAVLDCKIPTTLIGLKEQVLPEHFYV